MRQFRPMKAAVALLLCACAVLAEDWSRFRGPNGLGVDDSAPLPDALAPDAAVWATELPMGKSSPALTEDKVFLTGHENEELITFALDRATGRVLWRRTAPSRRLEKLNRLNGEASSSPVTDGENVYAFFGGYGLVSYGPDGNERWRVPMGPFSNFHGMGASPIYADGKVIMVVDQDQKAFVVAEGFGEDLAAGLSDERPSPLDEVEEALLLEEVKIGCTHAMLLCLARGQRLAYILGEILELDHNESAEILNITPSAFRKRLSRARAQLTAFMQGNCGLVNGANACRCRRRVTTAIRLGRVEPDRLLFAKDPERARSFPDVLGEIRKLERARRSAALYRSHRTPALERDLSRRLGEIVA